MDRLYCTNHMWAERRGDVHRFGFTAYAVRLLQDVYFLEWNVDEQATIRLRQTMGFIESKKAESDLYAPAAGELVRFNARCWTILRRSTSTSTVQAGCLKCDTAGDGFLSPDDYLVHLTSVWEVTQRTIKGQLN